MEDREVVEKIRQEIMRFRELLNIMGLKLKAGEKSYAQLFSNCSPEDMTNLKEKDLQWKVAQQIHGAGDVSSLAHAVIQMRFEARELEKAFSELHDIIVTVQEEE